MRRHHKLPFGTELTADGVRFRLWAPRARKVELLLEAPPIPALPMVAEPDGWFSLTTGKAGAGSRYRYSVDGAPYPDPASRYQPDSVHGASEVIDPAAYEWRDAGWNGRPWHELVIYELHLGAFSERGDFTGAIAHLDHLVELGVTAIELTPIAECPGRRNWGYDGVQWFAPSARYGRPEELKALIDECHARGVTVFLDVVYNHFGPEGNYLHAIAPDFFTERHHTPWGAAINYDGPRSRPVRDFVVQNVLYWLEEFHLDGLRLDAVHAILDQSAPDILTELAETVRRHITDRPVHLVLENDRNEARRRPFPFFCDFGPPLDEAVREGRRREFAHYPEFADPEAQRHIPDPNTEATFAAARLDWSEPREPEHASWLERYRKLLTIRHREIVPRLDRITPGGEYELLGQAALRVTWRLGDGIWLVLLANFADAPLTMPESVSDGRLLYSSGEPPGDEMPPQCAVFYLLMPR